MNLFSKLFNHKTQQNEKKAVGQTVIFPNTGKQAPIAIDIYQFCEMVTKDEDCALIFRIAEYKDQVSIMMQHFGKNKNPISFPLICTRCSIRLDKNLSFLQSITGFNHSDLHKGVNQTQEEVAGNTGRCPHCALSDKIIMVHSMDKYLCDLPEVTQSDLQLLRIYFKHLASLWWPGNKTGGKMCDSCMTSIANGDGYIYGIIDNNVLKSYMLYCEVCINNRLDDPSLLKGLQSNPDYMGKGLVQQAREYTKHLKN